jgi:hypothetical protein
MVGITLSAEQIRTAPLEVRRWLQREIASSLDFQSEEAPPETKAAHVVGCEPDEAFAIFAAIREMPAAVNVFFELGREGEAFGSPDVCVHKLGDMMHRARLQTLEQLDTCLRAINQAVRALKNDEGATLYVLDPRGYCVTARVTQKSVMEVWHRIVASQNLASAPAVEPRQPPAGATRPAFPEISAAVPPDRMHMNEATSLGAA